MRWFIKEKQNIDHSEKLKIKVVIFLLMIISGLPALLGYIFAPQGLIYAGLRSLAAGDLFVYFSYVNQIKAGNWLLYDFFTAESQVIGMFNVWWLIVGLVARVFNLSADLALVFFRVILVPVLVWIFYQFCSYFLQNSWQRIGAILLGFFSSGLGFWAVLLSSSAGELVDIGGRYNWPIDLWITEATLFNAVFFSPLVMASLIFTLAILLLMIISLEQSKNQYAFLAGILALIYLNFHPYYWPVIIAVPLIFSLVESLIAKKIKWQMFKATAILFFVSLPSVVYHFWLIKNEEIVSFRALQNITPMVQPFNLLVGYGFLWLGLGLGIYFLIKQKLLDSKWRYLIIWLGVLLVLSYSPFPFQSRYSQGMQLPLVIFTTVGLWYWWQWLKVKVNKDFYEFFVTNNTFLVIIFMLFFSSSVLFNFSRDVYYLINPYSSQTVLDNYYLDQDLYLIIEYLEKLPKYSVVVLSNINKGKAISAFSLQKSFVSHSHETIFFKSKALAGEWFYSESTNNLARGEFLGKNDVDYVLDNKKNNLPLLEADFLQVAVSTEAYVLYQVIR
jgi:hypothetical protein